MKILAFLLSALAATIPSFGANTLSEDAYVIEGLQDTVICQLSNGQTDGCHAVPLGSVRQRGKIWSFPYNGESNFPLIVVNGMAKRFMETEVNDCLLTISPISDDETDDGSGTANYSFILKWNDNVPLKTVYDQSFLFVHYKWQTLRFKVASIMTNDGSITGTLFTSTPPHHIPITNKEVGCWIVIVNPKTDYLSDISEDCFVYDGNMIHYKSPGAIDVHRQEIAIADEGTLLIVRNCRNVTIRGLHFQNNGIRDITHGSGYQAEVATKPCILIENSDSITIEDCEFSEVMGYCVYAYGNLRPLNNIVIRNCSVHDTFGGGFHLTGCHNSSIENNLISHFGLVQGGAVGILLRENIYGCNVSRNTVCYGPYTGISLGWTWGYNGNYSVGGRYQKSKTVNNLIAYNHIHHCMNRRSDDGAGIYTLGESPGTVIRNNYIHDIYSRKERYSWAMYFDEGSSHISFQNNVCRDCDCFIHVHYGYDNEISHNVFWNCDTETIFLSRPEKIPEGQKAYREFGNTVGPVDDGPLGIISDDYGCQPR